MIGTCPLRRLGNVPQALRHAFRAAILLACARPPAAAAPLDPASVRDLTPEICRRLLDEQAAEPSVHDERATIDAALEAAGVPAERIARLWQAVASAVLPGAGSRIDGFLFLTRDPEWRALRGRFAEFLDLPGVSRLSAAAVHDLETYAGLLSLPGITAIDAETLAAFDGFGATDWGAALELSGITTLDVETAAGLAKTECLLILPALRELSEESARGLAAHEGIGLVVGGFPSLSGAAAAALAEVQSMQGMLLLDLETLDSAPLAEKLSSQDNVFLPRLRTLSPAMVESLSPSEGGNLSLPGLDELLPEVAERLARSGYYRIALDERAFRRPETVRALVAHPGPLILVGSRPPRPDTAALLAARTADIHLPSVATMPPDVAAALEQHAGSLVFEHLAALDAATATRLARHAGPVSLGGLRSIDLATARVLATTRGGVALPDLAEVSPRTIAVLLAAGETVALPPREALRLTPEADGSGDDFVPAATEQPGTSPNR